jgi:hypothetical protein
MALFLTAEMFINLKREKTIDMRDKENTLKDDSKDIYVLVMEYDEEDWKQLLRQDLMEEYEDGKIFLRVN